jgi:carbon monoxide dehydrogenase subunit G
MPALSETTTIALPADEVWPLLSDPALVASCIPGATLSPETQPQDGGDGLWRGSVRVKFGPTVAVFRGEATLAFDHTQRTCTIEGRGIDGRGASRALASGTVKVTAARRRRSPSTAPSASAVRWKPSPMPAACMSRAPCSANSRPISPGWWPSDGQRSLPRLLRR